MPQLLHPRLIRISFFLVLGSLIFCGYIAGITVIIVRLIQGADLRLIALSVLLGSAVFALNCAIYCLLILPEWAKRLLGWRILTNVGHWPRKTALLLWMRVKYGKQQPGIYTPVDSPNRQTRLLVVEAGQSSDEIRCSLLPVYLQNDCPEFEAPSYTWGQSYSPRHIVLNGSPFAITLSLYGALKQLRRNDVSRVLWVDALSIDQSNIPERSEQVSLMKLIYASASNVIIWLGEESVSTRHAMDLLCSASEQVDPHTWLSDRLKITFQSDTTQWKALLSLFRKDYWSRMWIIQETAVATKLEIVCGSLRCKWEVALAAQSAWMNFKAMMLSREQQDIIDSMEGSVSLEVTPALLPTLIQKNNGPMTLSINRHNFRLARASSLVGLLQRNWTAQATDPRDRIFALLGLATDCQRPTLPADYSLSQWEVYLRMMNFLLENYGNLDIIAYSGLWYFPRPGHFLNPSWTPTFYWASEAPNTAVTSQYLYIHPDKLRASSNRKARAKFLPQRQPLDKIFGINRAILRAQICRIDRISKSLFSPSNTYSDALPIDLIALQKKLQIASTWLPVEPFSGSARRDRILVDKLRTLYHYFVLDGELSSHDQSAEGKLQKERKAEILWRTLVLNRKIDGTTAPDTWSSIFAVVLEGPSLLPADFEAPQVGLSADNRAIAYIQPFLQATHQLRVGGRWLFTTDGGRLGIANHSAMVGDYVCVILGCNMPMIMRECEKRKGDEFVQAQLCGPAYMHEYMQGKAVEELDIGQLTLQTVDFV
jgi:hypothetical protein